MTAPVIRIGGGDPIDPGAALPDLVRHGALDYLIIDYLSEFSLPNYAHNRRTGTGTAYGAGFVGPELAALLSAIVSQRIRIVTNAGALDPRGCATALTDLAKRMGVPLVVAVVEGDDLLGEQDALRRRGIRAMGSNADFPSDLASINAYIGAAPIAAALAAGADVVITGRVVDSALTLGPLIHEFGWRFDDYDRLAAGTLIGHLLECGAQPTGALFTDWRDVPNYAAIGYPIAECRADGTAVLTKPEGTGGLVSVATVAEQTIYEIGDPQRYFMPDVTCDFTEVCLSQVGPDRVHISGARGYPPTGTYKVSATAPDGWRAIISFVLRGTQAQAKARHVADILAARSADRLREMNLGHWTRTKVELIGSEETYGPNARRFESREIVCRIVVDHEERSAVEMFLRLQRSISISTVPGIATVPLGASVTPVYRVFSFLHAKQDVDLSILIKSVRTPVAVDFAGGFSDELPCPPEPLAMPDRQSETVDVPLSRLAWTRSGDKGDMSNIAVIARNGELLPYIGAALTPQSVANWYEHLFGTGGACVERFALPGMHALNFLLHGVLEGGGSASLRSDPMGKALAQQLLDFPVPVPISIASRYAERSNER